MRGGEREGDAVAGLGAAERRRVLAGMEAPPARAPTLRPFVRSAPGSPLSWGSEWGRRRESRAARPAGGALGLRALFGARLGLRGARESGLLRPPSQAHCSAGSGPAGRRQGSKSGRGPGRGRRAPGESETSCQCFCFLFKNAPWTRWGCFPNPQARRGRPGGGGRRRGPASGAFPATCQFYCCRASESLRISPGRRSARRTPKRLSLTRPSRLPPRPGPARGAPSGGAQ